MKNILMNVEMTKAILDGRKVQTRRVIKYGYYTIPNDMNEHSIEVMRNYCDLDENNIPELKSEMIKHAKYQIDETIWVRESFVIEGARFEDDGTITHHEEPIIHYKADNKELSWMNEWEEEVNVPWKPPMHMNRELARIFLKITNVRVERLQDISFDDIEKEGVTFNLKVNGKNKWKILWNSTAPNGYKWEDNPYVFVYEFERVDNENKK